MMRIRRSVIKDHLTHISSLLRVRRVYKLKYMYITIIIPYVIQRAQALRRRRESLEAANEQTRQAEVTLLSTPFQTLGRIALAVHIHLHKYRYIRVNISVHSY